MAIRQRIHILQFAVSPIDPTKRGLKVSKYTLSAASSSCFTHRPDEKGTERVLIPNKVHLRVKTFHPSTRRKGD